MRPEQIKSDWNPVQGAMVSRSLPEPLECAASLLVGLGHTPAPSQHPTALVGKGELGRWDTLWEVLVWGKKGTGWRKLLCLNHGPHCEVFFPLVFIAHREITHSAIAFFKEIKKTITDFLKK